MKNKKKFLNKKFIFEDKIIYEKAVFLNNIYNKKITNLKKDFLPNGWHWIFFCKNAFIGNLATDGHLKRGVFLPELKGYKRLFYGANLSFKKKIPFGSKLKKISLIESIDKKKKESNNLYFINIRNTYRDKKKIFLEETQNLVFVKNDYISNKKHSWSNENIKAVIKKQKFNINNISLFKYSALTFNSHRIHYDLEYAKNIENYEQILVHGPLLATILFDTIKNLNLRIKNLSFRILSPTYVNEDFHLKIFSTYKTKVYKAYFYKKNLKSVSFYSQFSTTN